MTTIKEQVSEFHLAFDQPVLATPQAPSEERALLRVKLICEEFFELVFAMFNKQPTENPTQLAQELIEMLSKETIYRPNLIEIADALADLDYVVEGTRLEFGIDGAPIAEEVHCSNMAKKGPGHRLREDGKIIKPPNWAPPDILGCLRRQGMK